MHKRFTVLLIVLLFPIGCAKTGDLAGSVVCNGAPALSTIAGGEIIPKGFEY